jgi:hypothetical protein
MKLCHGWRRERERERERKREREREKEHFERIEAGAGLWGRSFTVAWRCSRYPRFLFSSGVNRVNLAAHVTVSLLPRRGVSNRPRSAACAWSMRCSWPHPSRPTLPSAPVRVSANGEASRNEPGTLGGDAAGAGTRCLWALGRMPVKVAGSPC